MSQVVFLEVTDFRNLATARLEPAPSGLTVIVGENGAGKTSLLEAVAYASFSRSFRGSPREALVRNGASEAIVRLEAQTAGRRDLIELALRPGHRDRARHNGQSVQRAGELLEALQVSVFTPDDLSLVKGAPQGRREFLDDVLVAERPRLARLCQEVDRILRQRATLLRQAAGRLSSEVALTLDVWDAQLAEAGDELVASRRDLLRRLVAPAGAAFARLSGIAEPLELDYLCSYQGTLEHALAAGREEDIRRQHTGVGPHRDEFVAHLGGLDARTRLSQGRQRAVTLALRLAAHELVTDSVGSPPVLLLDDAFSELDERTAAALLAEVPVGQALLTTAGPLPEGAEVAALVKVVDGTLTR